MAPIPGFVGNPKNRSDEPWDVLISNMRFSGPSAEGAFSMDDLEKLFLGLIGHDRKNLVALG